MEPNLFAICALVAWPVVGLWLFLKKSTSIAVIWTILGGQLLLPVAASIKIPMVPGFDKTSIPILVALFGILATRGHLKFRNGFGMAEILFAILLLCPFVTSQLNTDMIMVGGRILPGVGYYDALSAVVSQLVFVLPFFFGRELLRGERENEEILRALVVAMLLYSIPILVEVRLSPQLHVWFYGYFPHDFGQQMRWGGFRPVVFLGHGLLVAFFVATATVAAAAFWRTGTRVFGLPGGVVTAYLGTILFLCKTLGALVYGVVFVPIVRILGPKTQVRIAAVLVAVALLYPTLRVANLFPMTTLLDMAESISDDRASSLRFRFVQEQQLLEHAGQRFLFGWGRFGRGRLYDEETGADISITDGHWIVVLGTFGFIGFLAEFGLLTLPVFKAASAIKLTPTPKAAVFLAALALIVAINIVDLLPNSPMFSWTWLLAGALLGRAESLIEDERRRRAEPADGAKIAEQGSGDGG